MDRFEALADPVRREILLLVREAPRTAGWLAGRFPISRPAVSRHLRVLRESGLLADDVHGRERFYRLAPAALEPVADYVERLTAPPQGGFAAAVRAGMDALDTEVHRARRDRRGGAPAEGTGAGSTNTHRADSKGSARAGAPPMPATAGPPDRANTRQSSTSRRGRTA